jgi:hypothetical protein
VRHTSWLAILLLAADASVASIDEVARTSDTRRPASEPVVDDTRLFLGPTGRPLRKGAGYFSAHWIFVPGVAYGVTDNVTLAGGVSLVPLVPLDEQAFFFTPKLGARLGERAALSVGGLLLVAGSERQSLAAGYAVGTWGTSEASFSVGAGVAKIDDGDDFGDTGDPVDPHPMLMAGGSWRVSQRVSFVTENCFLTDGEFALVSAGLRFRSNRLTVDVAFFADHEIGAGGLAVIPWLSFSYYFSPPRARK